MSLPRAVALVPVVLGVLLVTGCAGGAVAEEAALQTKAPEPAAEAVAEACLLLQSGAQEFIAIGEQENAFSAAMADPAGHVAKFESADAAFAAAVDQVSNSDVRVPADTASEAMHSLVAFLSGAIADPASADLNQMGPLMDGITAGFAGIGEVCD